MIDLVHAAKERWCDLYEYVQAAYTYKYYDYYY